jgi:hypothetical protein
MYEFFRRSIQK